jgi:hypothetical protein
MTKFSKVLVGIAAVPGIVLAWAAVAAASTTPTAVSIATDTASSMRDQFLPVMAAVIPIALVVVVAKRGFRWAKGQAG